MLTVSMVDAPVISQLFGSVNDSEVSSEESVLKVPEVSGILV